MYLLVVLNLLMLSVSIIVMFLASLISKKTILDYEKNSPFECGFDPKTSSRLPFSLCFFLIAIIFLIFDIEIALLLPMIYIMKTSNLLNFSLTLMFFIFILILGLYYEWNQGSLNWSN